MFHCCHCDEIKSDFFFKVQIAVVDDLYVRVREYNRMKAFSSQRKFEAFALPRRGIHAAVNNNESIILNSLWHISSRHTFPRHTSDRQRMTEKNQLQNIIFDLVKWCHSYPFWRPLNGNEHIYRYTRRERERKKLRLNISQADVTSYNIWRVTE